MGISLDDKQSRMVLGRLIADGIVSESVIEGLARSIFTVVDLKKVTDIVHYILCKKRHSHESPEVLKGKDLDPAICYFYVEKSLEDATSAPAHAKWTSRTIEIARMTNTISTNDVEKFVGRLAGVFSIIQGVLDDFPKLKSKDLLNLIGEAFH